MKEDVCRKCRKEDEDLERRTKRDFELEKQRLARQTAYQRELDKIKDEIDLHRRQVQCMEDADEAEEEIKRKRKEAKDLAVKAASMRDARTEKDGQTSGVCQKHSRPQTHDHKPSGPAEEDWRWMKEQSGAEIEALDELMAMIGLEAVKEELLSVKARVDIMLRQKSSLTSERFNCIMLGNPGTGMLHRLFVDITKYAAGKTTVARLYAQFLGSIGVIPGTCFKEITGSTLASGGVAQCTKLIDELLNDGGGVLFIDEAYQLTSGHSAGGRAVLDYLLPEVENHRGKVAFVLAGYNKEMETVFAHNPGLSSRFPVEMKFNDYTDEELLAIFELHLHKRYPDGIACEDGSTGLYCRIVARRVGRGRNSPGFGNARAVENALGQVIRRQAKRLLGERRAGNEVDHLMLTKEDLIGPEPSVALENSEPRKKLQNMVGLSSVKSKILSFVGSVQQNYIRELKEQSLIEYSLNKVFLGSPGTGKTTVAKLYGAILVELGILSKGEGM